MAPPQLGDFSAYTDATGFTSTNDEAYRSQFAEVAAISATLTAEQKAIAEYWADGPLSSTPPGHWNEFAHDLSARETFGLADDVKMFFALNNALFDTGIAIWDANYAHDYVRPQTAIRHLYEDEEIIAWAGPNKGAQNHSRSGLAALSGCDLCHARFPGIHVWALRLFIRGRNGA